VLGWAIPETIAQPLEVAVGAMLVGLGTHVLWRLWRDRVNFYRHRDAAPHTRAHSRAGDRVPNGSAGDEPAHEFRWRSLAVGLMHGMAGSAALLVLAISQVTDPMQGMAYVVLFGLGSMIGMGAPSGVIAAPLVATARLLTWMNRGLRAAVGLVTVGIGTTTIYTILVHA
jgi:ABC-type nickel/cobalt efflux system permease component RcnA